MVMKGLNKPGRPKVLLTVRSTMWSYPNKLWNLWNKSVTLTDLFKLANQVKTTSPCQETTTQHSVASHSASTTTPNLTSEPEKSNQSHTAKDGLLNRFKIKFENVVHKPSADKQPSMPKPEASVTNSQASAATGEQANNTDMVTDADDNQKTMTKKDGLALLAKCKEELKAKELTIDLNAQSKSPSEIANKLNDLYFKHMEEENKEQSKLIFQ